MMTSLMDGSASNPMSQTPDSTGDMRAYFGVDELIHLSRPDISRSILLLPTIGMAALLGALVISVTATAAWGKGVALVLLAISVSTMIYLARIAAAARVERQRVRQAEELVTLRHWPQAASTLVSLLRQPMRLNPNRRAALTALVRTLGRYGLYDEAIDTTDAILDDPGTDPATRFSVGCGRAMLLLQGGRLSDANEAISRLRSETRKIAAAVDRERRRRDETEVAEGETAAQVDVEQELPEEAYLSDDSVASPMQADLETFDPAALMLVELYRDVQTRHDEEILQLVEEKQVTLREQLGMRLGDALAFGALAAHRLDQPERAGRFWADATCLVPPVELIRRYPEVADVASRYPVTVWPSGMGEAQ